MRNLNSLMLFTLCFCLMGMSIQAQAADPAKTNNARKERLVLMPLRVGAENQNMLATMEAALAQGLQQKYKVFSGEEVAQKTREILGKESNPVKKTCDETPCMEGIANAFLAELLATAEVSKLADDYAIALSIQNIFDNTLVYSKSVPCKKCDAHQVADKLNELIAASTSPLSSPVASTSDIPAPVINNIPNEPETALWYAARNANTIDGYQTYLGQFPKGKYFVLANGWIGMLTEEAANETRHEDAAAWQQVQSSEDIKTLQSYLDKFPAGSHVADAQAKLAAILKALLQPGRTFSDCPDCPEMVVIPAGNFDMGGDGQLDGQPIHHVTLSKPFAVGKTEVTQGQWRAVMGGNPSKFSLCGDTCPVEQVSWNEAKEFIQKLNAKTGKEYRLPSEAEWEYACRAGEQHKFCGSDDEASVAWYRDNSKTKTHPVAQKQANAFGLYDMGGNVAEWVEDNYHDDYKGAPEDGSAWQGIDPHRVVRGSSWGGKPQSTGVAKRGRFDPASRGFSFGFRLARMMP